MFLDDIDYQTLDPDNMRGFIEALPDQFEAAWARAKTLPLPSRLTAADRVVICGMGGSAISGDLLAGLIESTCPKPIFVNRDYDLPAFATGPQTLVICLSHSGSTEETLSAAQQAIDRETRLLAITTGGDLGPLVESAGGTVWNFAYASPPRAALGWLYGLLLGAAVKLGLSPDLESDVEESIARMRRDAEVWATTTMTNRNNAKRVAGQIVDCVPVVWGAGFLAPVARRWKTQFNENAKTGAFFEQLPELNHNAVVGILTPTELINRHKFQIMQLESVKFDHPRNRLRHAATETLLREAGVITEVVKARGESRLTQQINVIQFGDDVSFYLAMAYGVDPTPIQPITMLKEKMAAAG
jgi:glucose/mannose-6-phosphate isomerase